MIILDTHALVWLDNGAASLGKRAIQIIDQALADDALAVSAISFWEVGILINKGRLSMDFPPDIWRKDLLSRGLVEIPMNGKTGIDAANLQNFHGDPADRIIIATTLLTGASLVTADEKILKWDGLIQKINARH
jgi:PIN domain nuclease of toxin-antitoxin system